MMSSNGPKALVRGTVDLTRFFFDLTSNVINRTVHPASASPPLLRVALVSDANISTSEEQLNVFSSYRSELREKLCVISAHLPLKLVLCAPKFILSAFDIVILKMSFRTSSQESLRIAQTLRDSINHKRMIYFDGDDDLCVQWPAILPYVDLYVKKHLFRNKSQYLNRFIGKSNLTDFVHRHFGYSFSDDPIAAASGRVPADQLGKLQVGFNLALDSKILWLYNRQKLRLPHDGEEHRCYVPR